MVHRTMGKIFSGPSGKINTGTESAVRRRIRFYGAVQGVGFRWRALHAAQACDCTGWCRNEWDGTVVMEIQGREEAIDRVITAIEAGRYVEIRSMDVETVPVLVSELGFRAE